MHKPVILKPMDMRKYRWSKTYESSEEELLQLFDIKKLEADRIVLEPYDTTDTPLATGVMRIWCAEGSMRVEAGSKSYSLQPGDTLALAKPTAFTAIAGLSGCAYYTTG